MIVAIFLACTTNRAFSSAIISPTVNIGCYSDPLPDEPLKSRINGCIGAAALPNVPVEVKASAHYGLGLLYHLSGRYDDAITEYTKAIARMRGYSDAYEARADAYDDAGQHDKAVADYAAAAWLNQDNAWKLNNRCWVRTVRGRPLDRALADCNEALTLRPDEWDILDTRCLVNFKMGNYTAAIADCNAVIEQRPGLDSSLFVRGVAKLRLGDTTGGNADIAAASHADYRVADDYALLGVKP